MSASRALASAKNRKAGLNTQSPSVPYPEPNDRNNMPRGVIPPSTPTKISVPQAIQMLGNRIDSLETTLQSRPHGGAGDTAAIMEEMEGKFVIDADVFQDIVNRLERLEASVAVIDTNQIHNQTVDNKLDSDTKGKIDMALANNENVKVVLEDVNNIKNTMLSLQSFVMETHAKLSEHVFSLPTETNAEYSQVFKPATNVNLNDTIDLSKPSGTIEQFEFPSEIPMGSLERPVLKRENVISSDDIEKIIKSSSEPHLTSKELQKHMTTLNEESIVETSEENITLETDKDEVDSNIHDEQAPVLDNVEDYAEEDIELFTSDDPDAIIRREEERERAFIEKQSRMMNGE